MSIKSFTSSSVKIFKQSSIFGLYNIMLILGTKLLSEVITMMKNYDQSVEINHNLNWPHILDHPYKISIIVSGSGKTNLLLNNEQKINNQIMTKFIYILKIHSSQSINCLLKGEKKKGLKN